MSTVTRHGLTYYPRQDWGMAGPLGPPMVAARPLFLVHHAKSPDILCGVSQEREREALRGIEEYQIGKFGRFSYQWVAFQSGNVYECQGWGHVGAHVADNNSRAYGVLLPIDGDRQMPTEAAQEAVRAIQRAGLAEGFLAPDFQLKGHGEVLEGYDCPGRLVKPRVRELFGLANRTASGGRPLLKLGERGPAVVELQTQLGMPQHFRTGYFGRLTDKAVRDFQASHGLAVDGLVGANTWKALGL